MRDVQSVDVKLDVCTHAVALLQDCTVICEDDDACKLHRIHCPDGYLCTVTCQSNNACDTAEFIQSASLRLIPFHNVRERMSAND